MNTLPAKLLIAFDAAKKEPTTENVNYLWDLLSTDTTDIVAATDNSFVRSELAIMWLNASLLMMIEYDAFGLTKSEVESVYKLISDEETLHLTLRDAESKRVLALNILLILTNVAPDHLHGFRDKALSIFATWKGVDLSNKKCVSVEELSGILYGPMAYSLYRTDVVSDYDLPGYLCSQNIPVIGGLQSSQPVYANTTVEIPSDLYENS